MKGRWLLIFLCLLTGSASGQRYPFFNFSIEHGLIQSQITCLTQDKGGQLWIGTLGGLNSYDGYSFKKFTIRQGLPHNKVSALNITDDGNIWVGSEKGIARFDGFAFHPIALPAPSHLSQAEINQITPCDSQSIWFINKKKIYKATRQSVLPLNFPQNKDVRMITSLNENELYFLGSNRRVVYGLKGNQLDSFTLPVEAGTLYQLGKLNDKQLYLLGSKGVYQLQQGRFVLLPNKHVQQWQRDQHFMLRLLQARDGSYWATLLEGGVVRIDNGGIARFGKNNGFSSNLINDIIEDREGNIWLASDGEGLYRYKDNSVLIWDETVGLPTNQIMSIAQSRSERLTWIGTYYSGLYAGKDNNYKSVKLPAVSDKVIATLLYDGKGLWIGCHQSGLWYEQSGKYINYQAKDLHLPSSMITCLYRNAKGEIFVGTQNGFAVGGKENFKAITTNHRIQDFISIGEDSVLVASTQGILLYTQGKLAKWQTHTILDSAQPECFAIKGHELWTGTADQGLFRYHLKDKSILNFTSDNLLKNDFIYSLLIDSLQQIWVGTGAGVSRLTEIKPGNYAAINFDRQHGVREVECNHNAIMEAMDGRVWVGTTEGIFSFDKRASFSAPAISSLQLTAVLLNGEPIADSTLYSVLSGIHRIPQHLRLPPRSNNLRFEFQALSLSGTRHIVYRYKLEGMTDKWSEWSGSRSISYPSLPSGKFVLHLQAKSVNDQQALSFTYPFEIITPIQKRAWFQLSLLALIVLIALGIQYAYTLRKRRRVAELERITKNEQRKIRQRTAEDFHDEVGNKITRINVLTSVLRESWKNPNPQQVKILDHIKDSTQQLYSGTRDILWSLDPAHDNLFELVNRLAFLGEETFADVKIQFTIRGQQPNLQQYKISVHQSRNILMICKEVFTNILKYAQATEVKVQVLILDNGSVQLLLSDNGKGFDVKDVQHGNGLKNMAMRSERIGAEWQVQSSPQGSTISLYLPKSIFQNN